MTLESAGEHREDGGVGHVDRYGAVVEGVGGGVAVLLVVIDGIDGGLEDGAALVVVSVDRTGIIDGDFGCVGNFVFVIAEHVVGDEDADC